MANHLISQLKFGCGYAVFRFTPLESQKNASPCACAYEEVRNSRNRCLVSNNKKTRPTFYNLHGRTHYELKDDIILKNSELLEKILHFVGPICYTYFGATPLPLQEGLKVHYTIFIFIITQYDLLSLTDILGNSYNSCWNIFIHRSVSGIRTFKR